MAILQDTASECSSGEAASLGAAVAVDTAKQEHRGEDGRYRLTPLWNIPFLCLGLLFMFLLYKERQRLGGESRYVPPASPREAVGEV